VGGAFLPDINMSFLGRWLSDVIRLALSLAGALLFMQAPALSHDYVAALAQVADSENRDIAGREATARNYYDLQTASETNLLATLRDREPSNAAGLDQSRAEADALATALAHIRQSPPSLRPIVAVWDLVAAPDNGKRAIVERAVRSFLPALQLSVAALAWALAGMVLGSLLGQLLLLPTRRNARMA
jgi:hypothetical protein